MKANINTLTQALKLSAKAHHTEIDIVDGFVLLANDDVPVLNDVFSICEAFTGNHDNVSTLFYTVMVDIRDMSFNDSVDEMMLSMALPYGWIDEIVE